MQKEFFKPQKKPNTQYCLPYFRDSAAAWHRCAKYDIVKIIWPPECACLFATKLNVKQIKTWRHMVACFKDTVCLVWRFCPDVICRLSIQICARFFSKWHTKSHSILNDQILFGGDNSAQQCPAPSCLVYSYLPMKTHLTHSSNLPKLNQKAFTVHF